MGILLVFWFAGLLQHLSLNWEHRQQSVCQSIPLTMVPLFWTVAGRLHPSRWFDFDISESLNRFGIITLVIAR